MTVKVIGEDPEIRKRVSCGNCGALLEYVPNDVQSRNGTDYGGGSDGCEWVECPNCKGRAIIRSW